MGKLDLIKNVLDKDNEYFIAEKRDYYSTFGSHREASVSIWLIALPTELQRQYKYRGNLQTEGLTVREVDRFLSAEIDSNIPLSSSYSPFQEGITLNSFSRIYPVTASRDFIRKAWALKSNEIWDYVELDKKLKDQRQNNG